jgi:hypothetical protein
LLNSEQREDLSDTRAGDLGYALDGRHGRRLARQAFGRDEFVNSIVAVAKLAHADVHPAGDPLAGRERAWKHVPSPNPSPVEGAFLYGVTALSARSAWVVGSYLLNGQDKRLVLHWNGTSWKNITARPGGSDLFGVAAASARNAWAVGGTPSKTLIIRWNGSAWK